MAEKSFLLVYCGAVGAAAKGRSGRYRSKGGLGYGFAVCAKNRAVVFWGMKWAKGMLRHPVQWDSR